MFLKRFSMAKHNGYTKVALVNFPKNAPFWGKWAIWDKFGQRLCSLLSYDPYQKIVWKNLEWWDTTVAKEKSNIFSKNNLLWEIGNLGSIWSKIIQPYISICGKDFFEIFWYDKVQYVHKSNISQFSQKHLL